MYVRRSTSGAGRRLLLAAAAFVAAAAHAEDFSAIHISDTHFNPHVAGQPAPAIRGAETFAWLSEQTSRPQDVPGLDAPVPVPRFGLISGDVFEYGTIDDTWAQFERTLGGLSFPFYPVTGNHDLTWNAIFPHLRARHGGADYSWDAGGMHFVALSSASPQEPLPSFDGGTRAWLRADLATVERGTPVVLAFHHPLNDGTLATGESDTLVDMLRDHNVALLLYGHGHSVRKGRHDGIDGVMGGSTFGPNSGYGLLTRHGKRLRYHYRYKDKQGEKLTNGWQRVLAKKLADAAPERLFAIARPTADERVRGDSLPIELRPLGRRTRADLRELSVTLDGEAVEVTFDDAGRATLDLARLTAGWHRITVRGQDADGRPELRSVAFERVAGADRVLWRRTLPAGLKAAPLLLDGRVIVAGTDGAVVSLAAADGAEQWRFASGAEILGGPVHAGGTLLFGSGDGFAYALDATDGRLRWKVEIGRPLYAPPAVADEVAYFADNGGHVTAVGVRDGQRRWTFARADYAIEQQPLVSDDLLIFGAWDGHLYAVDRGDGTLRWKQPGPKSSEGGAARYYAPADCPPIALDGHLLVCDRGYVLGRFERDGTLLDKLGVGVSGIAACPDDASLLARGIDNRVFRLRADGEKLWEQPIAAGRLPVPPTIVGQRFAICSNAGLLTVGDLSDGAPRWTYQATPGFYVMAPLAVDAGHICVAGMDGSVTLLRLAPNE